jgi:superfamily II DNA helicase RecQ
VCCEALQCTVENRWKGKVVLAGETRIVCATIAFGLGMDLPGVGLIVHWDAATSLQEYVQQIGRGGRCGCKCLCITLYDAAHVRGAMRQAASIKDVVRRDAELSAIQQVSSCFIKLDCCMHKQHSEDVGGADAGVVSATKAAMSPQFH